MIFVTGPLFAGKRSYARRVLGLAEKPGAGSGAWPAACGGEDAPWARADADPLASRAVWDVQDLAAGCDEADLPALADELAARYEVVIATEVGAGVVPIGPLERRGRERAGRLACLLAERATTVVRLCCGIPQALKGELPC